MLLKHCQSQSPLVGASGPAEMATKKLPVIESVSIPSGRGFWAGMYQSDDFSDNRWVSIPSGRGFWAGKMAKEQKVANVFGLNCHRPP